MTKHFLLCALCPLLSVFAAELPDISSIPADLTVPALSEKAPAPGLRVKLQLPGYASSIYHVLYLPTDWQKDAQMPLIVEFAGNGGYKNKYGDVSTGRPEGSNLGYGLTGGKGALWLCLPYLNARSTDIAIKWWGDAPAYDPQPTLKYAREAVQTVLRDFGGDPRRVLLCGFSRGAIACGYLGLHDDETSALWTSFFAYSHFDGIKTWPYPASDRASALTRLQRLGDRPVFICAEGTQTEETEKVLRPLLPKADLTFQPTGFRNHNDTWLLRPCPAREKAREWLRGVFSKP